jgi:hypothetical protein
METNQELTLIDCITKYIEEQKQSVNHSRDENIKVINKAIDQEI